MAIKYKVLPRKNPRDLMAPEKFYAAAVADGDVDLDRLAELISYQCTVTATDCYAVLLSLEHNIIGELGQGRIVKLGRLGNFQVGISSEGKEMAADVSAAAIKKSRILFRPGKKLRSMLNELSFRKAG
ncbi:DNA-binding protein [Flavobacterium sp. GSP27]|uniref:HU family DNA-binding protein n=1 Tax=unclassified Flavobacterium TaxID=196869 RepID=UPI000F819ABA|nr:MULTISPECIES: HU family DNA-binding protein [unclassified Flavobacterium]RTY84404.1 DNA-binding protein [Flavobacterium sp. LS1P28]RTZ09439.1 DNA-binding protein [Flavobacterium sp. GSP27]